MPIVPTKEIIDAMSNFVMGEHRYAAALQAAPAAPAPKGKQCPSDAVASYEIIQDDMQVAATSGKDAYKEILYYAAQYGQDGPLEIFEVRRVRISAQPKEPT